MDTTPPSIPTLPAFHLAPGLDYTARLTKEMQSTRDLLEARMASLASPSVFDPKEVMDLKKTLNSLCNRTMQKGTLLKRLKGKLEEEKRERSGVEGEFLGIAELFTKISNITGQIESVSQRTLEEESHSYSYSSLKSKESASLVSVTQLITKERVQELEAVHKRLMRKYEVIQQTQFKAASHLTLTHEELRRELKSSNSIRRRQEYYSELAESVRQQKQERVEKGIEAVSKARLSWEDRQSETKMQLLQLQSKVKSLEDTREELRKRKEAVSAYQSQFTVLEGLLPTASSRNADFPSRVVSAYKELGQQQLSLSGRFQDLSNEHDVKKKQCEEIRGELDRLRAGVVQGEVKWKGSVNMIRAAVEDNQKYKKLKKSSHDSEQSTLNLYLKLTHFLVSALLRVQKACTDPSLESALRVVLSQLTQWEAAEKKKKETKESVSGKRRNSLKTFQTEIDVPSLKPSLTYALSLDDMKRTLLRFHPSLSSEAPYLAIQLHSIPPISFFLSLSDLESYFQSVSPSEILVNCGGLVTAGYAVLTRKLGAIADSLPIFSTVKKTVDSTDMSQILAFSRAKPPHPVTRVRKLPVEGSEDVARFSENLSNRSDSDETVTVILGLFGMHTPRSKGNDAQISHFGHTSKRVSAESGDKADYVPAEAWSRAETGSAGG